MKIVKRIGTILTVGLFVSLLNTPVLAKDLPIPDYDPNGCSSCQTEEGSRIEEISTIVSTYFVIEYQLMNERKFYGCCI